MVLHPEATADPRTIRWVVPAGTFPWYRSAAHRIAASIFPILIPSRARSNGMSPATRLSCGASTTPSIVSIVLCAALQS